MSAAAPWAWASTCLSLLFYVGSDCLPATSSVSWSPSCPHTYPVLVMHMQNILPLPYLSPCLLLHSFSVFLMPFTVPLFYILQPTPCLAATSPNNTTVVLLPLEELVYWVEEAGRRRTQEGLHCSVGLSHVLSVAESVTDRVGRFVQTDAVSPSCAAGGCLLFRARALQRKLLPATPVHSLPGLRCHCMCAASGVENGAWATGLSAASGGRGSCYSNIH